MFSLPLAQVPVTLTPSGRSWTLATSPLDGQHAAGLNEDLAAGAAPLDAAIGDEGNDAALAVGEDAGVGFGAADDDGAAAVELDGEAAAAFAEGDVDEAAHEADAPGSDQDAGAIADLDVHPGEADEGLSESGHAQLVANVEVEVWCDLELVIDGVFSLTALLRGRALDGADDIDDDGLMPAEAPRRTAAAHGGQRQAHRDEQQQDTSDEAKLHGDRVLPQSVSRRQRLRRRRAPTIGAAGPS